jgi:hypothetical protein
MASRSEQLLRNALLKDDARSQSLSRSNSFSSSRRPEHASHQRRNSAALDDQLLRDKLNKALNRSSLSMPRDSSSTRASLASGQTSGNNVFGWFWNEVSSALLFPLLGSLVPFSHLRGPRRPRGSKRWRAPAPCRPSTSHQRRRMTMTTLSSTPSPGRRPHRCTSRPRSTVSPYLSLPCRAMVLRLSPDELIQTETPPSQAQAPSPI